MNEELREAMEKGRTVLPHLQALIANLEAVVEENDPVVIAVYIEAMQENENNIGKIFGGGGNVKESIKNGHGDFAKIQEKCIRLGIV